MTAVDYFNIYKKYAKEYDTLAVIYQVGSFYELYGVDNKTEKIGNAVELSKILNIVLTRKNKKILNNSIDNPLLLGFPCVAIQKYIKILLEHNYTIIIVDQKVCKDRIERNVVNIVSPSTYIENNDDDIYLLLIYVSKSCIGLSIINTLIGNSIVYECYNNDEDALSFIKKYNPREIVICYKTTIDKQNILTRFDIDGILCHYKDVSKQTLNESYQNSVLNLVFDNKSMLSTIEYLNLERYPYASISYVLLIEFLYSHNPLLIQKLSKPEIFIPNTYFQLYTNTIDQLNVKILYAKINKCLTTMGKRLLLKRLLYPIFDIETLQTRYEQLSEFGDKIDDKIDTVLEKIYDISKLHRRLSINILTPSELYILYSSYVSIIELTKLVQKQGFSIYLKNTTLLEECIHICEETFHIENLPSANLDNFEVRIFKNTYFPEFQDLYERIDTELQIVYNYANKIGGDVKNLQSSGYYIHVSSAKAKSLSRQMWHCKENKGYTHVTNDEIHKANINIQGYIDKLKIHTTKRFKGFIKYFLHTYNSMFSSLENFVSEIDVVQCLYKVSCCYKYCRPVISGSISHIEAKDIRHPIIELIDNGIKYVSNDISIGKTYNGIVLYSMNSCGKTSLLKACGLCLILAQTGSYVPASEFTFYPFKCIMTRILTEDNIFKGQSSFVAEMSELRNILHQATDPYTLVLADEISHNTEHTSGSAIFVSSVEILAKRNVNFMFTTHLHNIYSMLTKLSNVKIYHLSVNFTNNNIIFERKLKDGPGDSIYGLEVCKFLHMDEEFITRAFHIRRMLTQSEQNPIIAKVSPYNKKKTITSCEICNYYPKVKTDIPLDVHHITRCNDKNKDNETSNLVTLCKQCHNKIHNDEITIWGYVQTTTGRKLSYE